jgi:omega-6 fatty acid desaturase (delta-12 desaturase)
MATTMTPAPPALAPDEKPERGSLRPVLDVIPAEAYENPTWKGLGYFARDLVLYAIAIAGLIAFANPLLVVPFLVLAALAVSGLFIVGHDSAHGALFKSERVASIVGHLSMLPSWHVYEGWRLGHNRVHHHYTVRQDFDFVWHPYTAQQYRDMNGFQRARHRFEWSWAGAGIYYLREIWWKRMAVGEPPKRWAKKIRRDRFIVLGFIVASSLALVAYGLGSGLSILGTVWLVARVVVLPFVAFCYVIGSLVHVHHIQPDIRWWKRREWTKWHGQMEGTTVLRVNPVFNFFVHWIMVHVAHHVDVRIPMYNLEMATAAMQDAFPGVIHDEPLRYRDFMANTRHCKLYDFDEGHWVSYAEALAAPVAERVPAAV